MSLTAQSTSLSLLDCIRRGDAAAWDRFAAIYVPLVYRWARQAHLQENDARDVCQDVFLAVVKNLPQFKRNEPGQSLRAWLRTITKNAVIDVYRREQRELGESWVASAELEWPAEESREGDSDSVAERRILLSRAVEAIRNDFEPATWQMFWELQVEEKLASEIAAGRNVSVWTVYKARSRVLARLRETLADFIPQAAKELPQG